MKKKLVNLFLLILTVCNVKSQVNNNLYFIQAHTFDDLGGMFQFDNYLYKFHNPTFDTIAELSTEKEFLHSVKFLPEFNKVIYYKDGWHYTKEKYLGIVDIKTQRVNSINIEYPSYKIMGGIFATNNKENIFVLDLFGRKQNPNEIFFGINLIDNSEMILGPEIYQNIKLAGSPGGVMTNPDYLIAYTSQYNGKLFIPQTPKVEDRPIFPLEIPDSLQIKEKKRVLILINDEGHFVIAMKESESNPNEIGYTMLVIKDKLSKQWFRYKIKGNCQVMRGFGSWIAGTVVTDNIKLIKDERETVKKKEVFSRISPGKDQRRKEATITGTAFDTRAEYLGVYYAGILYLLNSNTKKYIEWNTGQGDSEILLVENNIVYYRVNDEIYKSTILRGEKLGKSELLIKDPRVPDIHWAFISK